jgi:hypothetical protein
MSGLLITGVTAEAFVHVCPVDPKSETGSEAPAALLPIVTVPEELTVIPPAPISKPAFAAAPTNVVACDDANTSPLID